MKKPYSSIYSRKVSRLIYAKQMAGSSSAWVVWHNSCKRPPLLPVALKKVLSRSILVNGHVGYMNEKRSPKVARVGPADSPLLHTEKLPPEVKPGIIGTPGNKLNEAPIVSHTVRALATRLTE